MDMFGIQMILILYSTSMQRMSDVGAEKGREYCKLFKHDEALSKKKKTT